MSDFGLSRRQFVKGGLALSVLGSAVLSGCGGSSEPFAPTIPLPPAASMVQPPVLRSENGSLTTTFRIRYEELQVSTPTGTRAASLRTWNGFLGGPTLRVKPGDRLVVELINELPPNTDPMPPDHNTPHHFNSINLHTHGLHVSPEQDDVLLSLRPGETYTYTYDIPSDHPCGTFWYHAHKHGATAMHLFSGMAGLLIVEGEVDNDPLVASATDLDFVIQELNLGGYGTETDTSTVYEVPDYVKPGPFSQRDSFLLVNGEFQPTVTVEPGRTFRLRVLNASVRQAMPLSIPGAKLSVLSQDGITMQEALFVDSITLAPANRADLLIKFEQTGSFEMVKGSFSTGGGNPLPSAVIAKFVVEGRQRDNAHANKIDYPGSTPHHPRFRGHRA